MSTYYVDAELVVVTLLKTQFPSATVSTVRESNLADLLPMVWVKRIGGGDGALSMDNATIDVDCYDVDELSVNTFAAQVRSFLSRSGGSTVAGATISQAVIQNFGWRPYANTNVRSAGMTVALGLHNHL